MYSKLTRNLDQFIRFQLEQYTTQPLQKKKVHPVITISREFGCEGFPVAKMLAEKLKSEDGMDWLVYNRELVKKFTNIDGFDEEMMSLLNEQQRSQVDEYVDHLLAHKPSNYSLYQKLARSVRALSERGHCIIIGSGGAILTADIPNSLNIRLKAKLPFRINRISNELSISKDEAKVLIDENDESRSNLIKKFTRQDVNNPRFYDLIIDNEKFSAEQITEIILLALNQRIPGWRND